jgi:putative transposase
VVASKRGEKTRLAQKLGVSRSSLYYRPKRPDQDLVLRQRIEVVMAENPGYGSPRVAMALSINRKRISRVMRKFALKPARRSKTPRKPLDRGRAPLPVPNIVKQLCPIVPNFVWVSDFTYIRWKGIFVYLCTVLDLFTWEVLGSNIGLRHDAMFVWMSVERAVRKAGRYPSWFHSDQGSEYASDTVQRRLIASGAQISMSPKSSPWWNGSQESFFGRFKVEFGDFDRFETLAGLIEELYQHLRYFSDRRIKSKLKMSPAAFGKKWIQNHPLHVFHSSPQVISLPPGPPSCRFAAAPTTTDFLN